MRYTGTSVNPARSIGPALYQGGTALSNLWIFIVGPFVGATIAAGIWKLVESKKKNNRSFSYLVPLQVITIIVGIL